MRVIAATTWSGRKFSHSLIFDSRCNGLRVYVAAAGQSFITLQRREERKQSPHFSVTTLGSRRAAAECGALVTLDRAQLGGETIWTTGETSEVSEAWDWRNSVKIDVMARDMQVGFDMFDIGNLCLKNTYHDTIMWRVEFGCLGW